MQIDLINHTYREKLTELKNSTLKRNWDILLLTAEGEYTLHLAGRTTPITLAKNSIAYIPAGIEFTRSILSPVTYYYISFYSQPDHPFCLSATAGKLALPDMQTESIFHSIKQASIIPNNRELITHIVEHIFSENYMFGKSGKVKFTPFSDEILSAIRYMNRNLDKKIDIDELAAHVYLSHSGLIWKFRNELDTTPSQYLSLLRLRYAKQLLLNHSYSIHTISEMCGYSTPYYFANSFRKHCGMSPTEFRKYHLKERK